MFSKLSEHSVVSQVEIQKNHGADPEERSDEGSAFSNHKRTAGPSLPLRMTALFTFEFST
jgi:hypothetical protein